MEYYKSGIEINFPSPLLFNIILANIVSLFMNSYQLPLVSVVIPSGRNDMVLTTITQLMNQTLDSSKYEIIVVTSSPFFGSHFRTSRVNTLQVERLFPPGKMRNIGAEAAIGKYFFFIDDDCSPSSEWLLKMLNVLKSDKKIGAVGCQVKSHETNFWNRCADYALFGGYQYDRKSLRDIGSAALAVKRQAFDQSGGFEETLLASEDWDFNFRLERKGWKRVFDPSVWVKHNHGRGSLRAIFKQAYQSGLNSGLKVQKAHFQNISYPARVSVIMSAPWYYWILIFPYAMATTVAQILEQRLITSDFFLFIPVIFLARLIYQLGVWHRLFDDWRCVNKSVF